MGTHSLGDHFRVHTVGRASICLKFSNGRIIIFDGVLHILGLARNFLLSISKLIDRGVNVQFSEVGVKMVRGAMVIERGSILGILY